MFTWTEVIPIDINDRRQQLLKVLHTTSADVPLTVKRIAELLHVSPRTVHSDLALLAEEAREEGLEIRRKSSKGVWLEQLGLQETGKAGGDAGAYILSRKERQDRILVALLAEEHPSIDGLAEFLQISRNTLLADMKDVQEILEKRGLAYDSKRGLGIWAHGGEQEMRDMLIHIFARAEYDFRKFSSLAGTEMTTAQKPFCDYAESLPVEGIVRFFLNFMAEREVAASDASANRMICALAVQLQRLRQGHRSFQMKQVEFLSNEGERMQELAEEIAAGLRQYHADFSRPEEIQYIMRELLHSKIFLFPARQEARQERDVNLESIGLARRFIEYAQVWLGDIYTDDDELLYSLAAHLQPAIERARFGIVMTNPLLGQIQEKYRSLFEVAKKAADMISESMGIYFSEDEIGYLTIHMGAAAERKRMRRRKKLSVLLVCGNGVGTANLLAMTLRNNLQYIHIAKILSFYKLEDKDLENIDLVISTVPLDIQDVAMLRVSPIMTDEEIRVIEGQIQYFYNKKYDPYRTGGAASPAYPGLVELLAEENISLGERASDWEDAVRRGGRLLEEAGAVTSHYEFEAFGCDVIKVAGHSFDDLEKGFARFHENKGSKKPTVILMSTVKGKGVSFMEDEAGWHGKAPHDEELAQGLKELSAARKEIEEA